MQTQILLAQSPLGMQTQNLQTRTPQAVQARTVHEFFLVQATSRLNQDLPPAATR